MEDDEAQVNLTRFSVLFPEKRDFFLEGQDVFAFAGSGAIQGGFSVASATVTMPPNNAPVVFFSRRIGLQSNVVVPILGGARVIGRGNGFQLGAIHMHTEDAVDAKAAATDFSVLRVNKDILKRSRIGAMTTRRSPRLGLNGTNYAYSVDNTLNPLSDLQINSYWSTTTGSSGAAGTASKSNGQDDQSYRRQLV